MSVCLGLAEEGCGSEHDNSGNERCHAGIRQDFIENSGHCIPRATSPIRADRRLQHRGEKVKFLRIRPLNARKKMMLPIERMTHDAAGVAVPPWGISIQPAQGPRKIRIRLYICAARTPAVILDCLCGGLPAATPRCRAQADCD